MRTARVAVAVIVVVAIIWLWTRRAQAQGFDDITGDDPDMRSPNRSLDQFAKAIATAEGFGVAGAIPTRAHNPGDLVLGDKGLGVLGSEKITVFANDAAGWNALWRQLDIIARGVSKAGYVPTMTIAQMGERWAPGVQGIAWANNVARALGVTSDAIISDWIGDYRP